MRVASPPRAILLVALLSALAWPTVPAHTSNGGSTPLDVEGVTAQIHRDDYGRPYIFAETNRALFVAYGYRWPRIASGSSS